MKRYKHKFKNAFRDYQIQNLFINNREKYSQNLKMLPSVCLPVRPSVHTSFNIFRDELKCTNFDDLSFFVCVSLAIPVCMINGMRERGGGGGGGG